MKRKSLLIALMLCFAFLGVANAQQALPYEYGFENNDLTIDGWTTSNLDSGSKIMSMGGSYGYVFAFKYTTNPPQYLISPELTGSENGVIVSFMYSCYSSYYPETFQVGYSTTTNATDSFTWEPEVTVTNVYSSSFNTYEKLFPAGTKYIAVKCTSNDMYYLFLDMFSFTALDPCGTPNNLASSNVTAATADLAWEGVQDTYTVRYRTAESVDFFEGFESGIPSDWTLIDNDGDGNNWYASTVGAYEGSGCATSASYASNALTPDNWLCTPQIALNGTMKVQIKAQDPSWPQEHFAIYATTATEPTVRNFTGGTTLVAETVATGEYVEYTADLSSFRGEKGYIAIRHFNCTDMFRLNVDNFGLYGAEFGAGAWQTVTRTTSPYTLSGLVAETKYEWQVQGNCEDGTTEWSSSAYFTTPSNCAAPTALTSEVASTSATISWSGSQDDYNIQYRKAASFEYTFFDGFENGLDNQGWTTIRNSGGTENTDWRTYDATNFSSGDVTNHSGSYVAMSRSWASSSYTVDNWLITPQVALDGTLKFWVSDDGQYHEHYDVYVSTTGNDIRSFELLYEPGDASAEWTEVTVDLSSYRGQLGYIALRHQDTDQDFLLIDDFGIGFEADADPWTTVSNVTSPYTIENLNSNTTYEWQVQGNNSSCDGGTTEWSAIASFTTLSGILFITDGNWNEGSNWFSGEVPASGADVTINANCIIPAGYLAVAGEITIGEGGSLTIQDGGQLIHTNTGVVATVEKDITGYSSKRDNYYLISTPVYDQDIYDEYEVGVTFPEDVTNMLENEYDLYSFDYSQDLEWINYENTESNFGYLEKNYGYLYANSEDVTLQFTGTTTPAMTDLDFLTGYYLPFTEEEYNFANWNMFGNPFLCNTYIFVYDVTNSEIYSYDHYKLDGEEFIASEDPFTPMEGGFFISEAASQYALVAIAENSLGKKNFGSSLSLNLTQNGKLIDVARVRFENGQNMPKVQLNPNHTKLFFNNDNNSYAVVRAESTGEMPVSFKAEHNGTYTLSFSNENVEFSYLHLIDNMTGNDIDLLVNPSYTFDAKTTDYASRFKLVFAEGNSDDNFAFFSNGSLVISNEGNATMNVYDVTGRLVNTQSVNGSCQVELNAPAGVYMIQLVNGDNTKTQKIVVK